MVGKKICKNNDGHLGIACARRWTKKLDPLFLNYPVTLAYKMQLTQNAKSFFRIKEVCTCQSESGATDICRYYLIQYWNITRQRIFTINFERFRSHDTYSICPYFKRVQKISLSFITTGGIKLQYINQTKSIQLNRNLISRFNLWNQ